MATRQASWDSTSVLAPKPVVIPSTLTLCHIWDLLCSSGKAIWEPEIHFGGTAEALKGSL